MTSLRETKDFDATREGGRERKKGQGKEKGREERRGEEEGGKMEIDMSRVRRGIRGRKGVCR